MPSARTTLCIATSQQAITCIHFLQQLAISMTKGMHPLFYDSVCSVIRAGEPTLTHSPKKTLTPQHHPRTQPHLIALVVPAM
jgi:hypothetical protein